MQRIRSIIKEYVNNGRINSIAAFLFLMAILLLSQVDNVIALGFYYAMALFCAFMGFFPNLKRMELAWPLVVFLCVVAVTGVINIVFVGNSTLNKQLFTLCSVGIALSFLHERIDDSVFLAALLLYSAVIFVRITINGVGGPLFVGSSENYVSVYLLIPAVLYYTAREQQAKKLVLWPALLVWVMCLMAQGRAGVLFSTFFVVSLAALIGCRCIVKMTKRSRIIICCSIAVMVVVFVILMIALDVIHNVTFLARFAKHGLGDNGRFLIWGEYFTATMSSMKNFLLGSDLTVLKWATKFHNNVHNSFINIHVYNGIFAMLMTIVFGCNALIFGLKQSRWVYLICLTTFCLRGATDYVFWGSMGTPVFLCLLFLPFVQGKDGKKLVLDIPKVLRKMKLIKAGPTDKAP